MPIFGNVADLGCSTKHFHGDLRALSLFLAFEYPMSTILRRESGPCSMPYRDIEYKRDLFVRRFEGRHGWNRAV